MAWLWGRGKGAGDIVEAVTALIRSAPARAPGLVPALEAIRESSTLQENHEVIGKAMESLVGILKPPRDVVAVRLALEILTNIMKIPEEDRQGLNFIEVMNTDTFVGPEGAPSAAIGAVLEVFAEADFYVRYYGMKLIEVLSGNEKLGAVQVACLAAPMAVTRVVELFRDPRDIIRNEAVLLLIDLCHNHAELQKSVVFSGAMEMVLATIGQERGSEGGLVIADCLQLLINLLRNNISNQNYFRETSLVPKFAPLLEVRPTESGRILLPDSKVTILLLALQLISALVPPSNPQVEKNQSALTKEKVFAHTCALGLGRVNSLQVRAQALEAIADLVRHHADNRAALASQNVEAEPLTLDGPLQQSDQLQKQNALLRATGIALYSQYVPERHAAVQVLLSYLQDHPEGQSALASTLLPTPDSEESSVGRHLVTALFAWDAPRPTEISSISGAVIPLPQAQQQQEAEQSALSAWYASVALQAILRDAPASKEAATRIPISFNLSAKSNSSGAQITLLSKCIEGLAHATKTHAHEWVRLALLRLLCVWLDDCPMASQQFLATSTSISFLVEQVTAAGGQDVHIQGLCALLLALLFLGEGRSGGGGGGDGALFTIIAQRIGLENLSAKLEAVRRSEAFQHAEVPAHAWTVSQLTSEPRLAQYLRCFIYDYDFTLFFKETADRMAKQIRKGATASSRQPGKSPGEMRPKEASGADPAEMRSLRSRIADLERQLGEAHKSVKSDTEVNRREAELKRKEATIAQRESEVQRREAELQRREADVLRKERSVAEREESANKQHSHTNGTSSPATSTRNNELAAQLDSAQRAYVALEAVLRERAADNDRLRSEVRKNADSRSGSGSASALSTAAAVREWETRFNALEQEQEELLVVLAKTEIENTQLKERLRLLSKVA